MLHESPDPFDLTRRMMQMAEQEHAEAVMRLAHHWEAEDKQFLRDFHILPE